MKNFIHSQYHNTKHHIGELGDKYLILAVVLLIIIGLIMVTSSSMAISGRKFDQPFYYLFRQGTYAILGLLAALIVLRIKMSFWQKIAPLLLFISIIALTLVLIPGIGKMVNGSRRWIGVGLVKFQISELVKLTTIIYMASYLTRHYQTVRASFSGFAKPLILLSIIALFLLLEPDFGATVVILVTSMVMLFLAGARLWPFVVMLAGVLVSLGVLAISSPYRLARLTSFLKPWEHQFDGGYQLTQSLIAFGRGGFVGVGLGKSVQKLFYLPEAHTDFLLAVLAEEFGLIGVLIIITLYVVIVFRALTIGKNAQTVKQHFSAFIAYGIAMWISVQVLVSFGVNSGLLPTKGLTLPLLSYGGSSVVIIFIALAILLRIDYETKYRA